MKPPLILASGSPARAHLLRRAQLPFDTHVSSVDEDAVVAQHRPQGPAETAALLARAKAEAVAARPEARGRLVLGCDSVFELDGRAWGKPWQAEVAVERIAAMSGRHGTLHTGHWLAAVDEHGQHTGHGALRSADVHFAAMSPEEIRAYVATGEPLQVAGSFTLDGRGAVFVERVVGDPNAVIGLSLSALRELLAHHGVSPAQWWTSHPQN